MSSAYDDPRRGAAGSDATPAPGWGRVHWSAIFAGAVVAIAVQVLLGLLGAGVGLGLVNPNGGGTPDVGSFGIGAGLWWFVSSIIALVIGGYVAAWLAGVTLRFDGVLHGLVVWGIAVIVTTYLLTSAVGGALSGAAAAAGGAVSAVAQGVKTAAPQIASAAGLSPDVIQQQAQAYLQPATNPDPASMSPQDAQKEVARLLPDLVAGGGRDLVAGGDRADQAKNRIIDIMAAQMKVGRDDAAKRFDDIQARLTQARDQAVRTARNAAEQGASAASSASLWAFAATLLGAIAAAIGGAIPTHPQFLARRRA